MSFEDEIKARAKDKEDENRFIRMAAFEEAFLTEAQIDQRRFDDHIKRMREAGVHETVLEAIKAKRIEEITKKSQKTIREGYLSMTQNQWQMTQSLLSQIGSALGQHTTVAKGALIIQSVMDTYAAANRALATYPPPWSFIAAAAVTAVGLANVAKIKGMAGGGFIGAQTGFRSQGFDTTPVMARPGEAIISSENTRKNLPAITQIMGGQSPSSQSGGGGTTINITNNISTIDAQGVEQFVNSDDFLRPLTDKINERRLSIEVNGVPAEAAI